MELAEQITLAQHSNETSVALETMELTPDWALLTERIRRGDPDGMQELYEVFRQGIRFQIYRQLGPQELDDRVHDVFLIVVQAIQRGELREPERLMGFVRTVVRRQVAAHIGHNVQARRDKANLEEGGAIADNRLDPERDVLQQERCKVMQRALESISERDREVLTRFYIQEQSQEQICEAMELTDDQFRLLKSRAKARFGEAGRRGLIRAGFGRFFREKILREHD